MPRLRMRPANTPAALTLMRLNTPPTGDTKSFNSPRASMVGSKPRASPTLPPPLTSLTRSLSFPNTERLSLDEPEPIKRPLASRSRDFSARYLTLDVSTASASRAVVLPGVLVRALTPFSASIARFVLRAISCDASTTFLTLVSIARLVFSCRSACAFITGASASRARRRSVCLNVSTMARLPLS